MAGAAAPGEWGEPSELRMIPARPGTDQDSFWGRLGAAGRPGSGPWRLKRGNMADKLMLNKGAA